MGGSTQHRKIIPLLKSGQRLDLALRKKLQESKRLFDLFCCLRYTWGFL
jgi:hypothetical protein